MWRFDVLETLDILTRLGVRDEGLGDAVELVLSKRDGSGRWRLENSFEGKTLVPLVRPGRPSQWVTLFALRALARLGEIRSAEGSWRVSGREAGPQDRTGPSEEGAN